MKRGFFTSLAIFVLVAVQGFCTSDWEVYKAEVKKRLPIIPGWCSEEKADKIMEIIHTTHPLVCVEIGVFSGSSLYPIAAALKYEDEGIVYAIDAWNNEVCLEGWECEHDNYQWWQEVDLKWAYHNFKKMLRVCKIESYCEIIPETSANAVEEFEDNSIDFLHIDGNHSESALFRDVTLYFPKVKEKGIIMLTDANATEALETLSFLLDHCELDESSEFGQPFLVFVKNEEE